MTLKMTTAQVVETSVTVTNSSFQNYTHPDDHTTLTINKVDIYQPSTRAFPSRSLELPRNFMTSLQKRLRNGVSRQSSNGRKFNRQPSKKAKFFPSTVKKAVVIRRQMVWGCFKSQYFSCSSRTAGSQRRVFLTGSTSFHIPKYTHFTVFSSHLLLNWHYNRLLSGSTSGFKLLMINCIDKNKKS